MHQENLSSGTVVKNRNQGDFVITCLRALNSFNVARFHCRTSCDSLSESAVDTFSGLANLSNWLFGFVSGQSQRAWTLGNMPQNQWQTYEQEKPRDVLITNIICRTYIQLKSRLLIVIKSRQLTPSGRSSAQG